MTVKQNPTATVEELGVIHSSLAQWCISILRGVPLLDKEGNAVLQKDGQPYMVAPSPAHLNIIRQFLKDNKIESEATPNNPMGLLNQAASGDNVSPFPFQQGSN